MPDLTPLETAEILERPCERSYTEIGKARECAASCLRKIAAGEYIPVSKVQRFLESQLSNAYYCTRVWEAWGVGTMTEDDFELIDVEEIISALMGKDDSNETD